MVCEQMLRMEPFGTSLLQACQNSTWGLFDAGQACGLRARIYDRHSLQIHIQMARPDRQMN